MKNNEDLRKYVQDATKCSSLNAAGTTVNSKPGRNFRKVIYIAALAGMGFALNSCMAGYVASEPSYMEYSRPSRPNNVSIWIDGDWGWNSRSHAYVQKTGYWESPRQGKRYVSGRWQSTPIGKSWIKGRWEREARKENKSAR